MTHKQPYEHTMKNIYSFIGRVLPKYFVQENSKADCEEPKSKEDDQKIIS